MNGNDKITFTSRLMRRMAFLMRKPLVCNKMKLLYRRKSNDAGWVRSELFIILAVVLVASTVLGVHLADTQENDFFSPYVDGSGQITRPVTFKEDWAFLGAWTLPDNKDDGMHIVYTQPGVVDGYKKNSGRFPDGAVIVKEVRAIKSQAMTTGANVIHAENEALWFVMIKDSKGRFPDNPNWGEGWGWALYKASDPSKNVSTDYKLDCLGCHIPAKQTDWIYTNGYPVLK